MYKLHSTYCTVKPYKCIFQSKETGAACETTKERLRKYPHVSQTQTDKAYHQSQRSHLISVSEFGSHSSFQTDLVCANTVVNSGGEKLNVQEKISSIYDPICSTSHGCV